MYATAIPTFKENRFQGYIPCGNISLTSSYSFNPQKDVTLLSVKFHFPLYKAQIFQTDYDVTDSKQDQFPSMLVLTLPIPWSL